MNNPTSTQAFQIDVQQNLVAGFLNDFEEPDEGRFTKDEDEEDVDSDDEGEDN